jgi:hypothetical protein
MVSRFVISNVIAGSVAALLIVAPVAGQAPSNTTRGAAAKYTPPMTPWGEPDIQGTYSNKDEVGTPMERPPELAGKRIEDFGEKEMAALRADRLKRASSTAARIGGSEEEDTGAGPSHWYEHLDSQNSQPWTLFEPADGKMPAQTADARARATARTQARRGRGPADSWEDRSYYDRCISRGLPGSMMPAIYGNSYDITQSPGYVAIRYEMIHETRIIPTTPGAAPLPSNMAQYMGVARGHWEGSTLVVETTNFKSATAYRGASEQLKIVERFIPMNDKTLRWEVRFEDPKTWEKPWAFGMPLKKNPDEPLFEYACHEGNLGLANILRAARAEEAEAAKGKK